MKKKQSIKMNRRAGICLGFFLLCPATQALALHGYTIIPLGTLGGSSTNPKDVNDLGMVVGSSQNINGVTAPFLWQNGESRSGFCGSATWESPCNKESDKYIAAINNNGLAVGHFRSIDHGGMVWDVNTPLYGTLIPIEKPTDINDSGVIIGESHFDYYNAPRNYLSL